METKSVKNIILNVFNWFGKFKTNPLKTEYISLFERHTDK
jgi:hypothetical protein